MFFEMKNRMAMYEISIKIVFRKYMFYNMVLRHLSPPGDKIKLLSFNVTEVHGYL
jgi:hypothetical protein